MTKHVFLAVGLAVLFAAMPAVAQLTSWSTAGANPERTSYVTEQVDGTLGCRWYRSIEAYIPQQSQLVAANNHLFVATARGLVVLNATDDATRGQLAWRWNTQMPIAHTPTLDQVSGTTYVYVPGTDRKIHCLRDNGSSYTYMWGFEGGGAFYTSPLIVNGRVYAGNRDGKMYAIWAQGQTNPGTAAWAQPYQTEGPVLCSAAYKDGVVFFASNDCRAYALNATTGALVWRTDPLPTAGFHSFWPVVWGNYVIFSGAHNYAGDSAAALGIHGTLEPADLLPSGGDIGARGTEPGPWVTGTATMDMSRVSQHFEDDPNPSDPLMGKPWRRVYFILARSNGAEYTMDLDSDTYPEYAPYCPVMTATGAAYPPVVGNDGVAYGYQIYTRSGTNISRAIISGWKINTPYMSLVNGDAAFDETMALSVGGNRVYANLCCSRKAQSADYRTPGSQLNEYWRYGDLPYNDGDGLPDYSPMWASVEGYGFYEGLQGMYGTTNGVYNDHGDQAPIVPYNGKIYVRERNCIMAWDATGGATAPMDTIPIQAATDTVTARSASTLKAMLEVEIQKILAVSGGNLKPGAIPQGQALANSNSDSALGKYFKTPGETFYVLSAAYPHLTTSTKASLLNYLADQYTNRGPTSVTEYGWGPGVHRTNHPIPSDQADTPAMQTDDTTTTGDLPPENIYGMWKYALVLGDTEIAKDMYEAIQGRLETPCPVIDNNLIWGTWDLNRWIAGYTAYLQLEAMAGYPMTQAIQTERDRLRNLWKNNVTKDSPFATTSFISGFNLKCRHLNVCRPFIWMTPEFGTWLRQNALSTVQAMYDEYNWVTPGWFIARYEGSQAEGSIQHLMDRQIYLAKAWVLQHSSTELDKYLDVPYFAIGDLAYIQHLCILIESIEGAVNYPPMVAAERYDEVLQNTPFTVAAPGVLNNDLDPEGQTLQVVLPIVDQVDHGTLSINANGSFTYTPSAGYTGPDSFQYKATDGVIQSNTVTVNITVIPPGAVWQNGDIGAVGAQGSLVKDQGTFTIQASGADIYGTADEFHYVYRQMEGDCDVIVRVASMTKPNNWSRGGPMIRQSLNANSRHVNMAVTGNAGGGVFWTRRLTDGATSSRTITASVFAPKFLKIERRGNNFTGWYSDTGEAGTWTQQGALVTVTMTDPVYVGMAVTSRQDGTLCTAVIDNVIAPYLGGGNQAPVASNDTYSNVTMNTPYTVNSPGVLGNDTDPDGNPITAVKITNPSHGSVTLNSNGSFTYTPTTGYTGADSFTYQAYDSQAYSNTATVNLTVVGGNNPPVATNDAYNNVVEDTPYTVNAPGVLGNDTDPDGNPITAVKIANPSHGTVTLNSNGSFTYTPTANYNGSDSFTYQAYDGQAYSSTATVSLTVAAVNDAPVAANDSGYSVNQDSNVTINAPGVLANDTDIDSGTITAIKVANPSHGTVTVNANGSFTYTPTGGYYGSDSFTYKANDGSLDSNTATVNITVNQGGGTPQTIYSTADTYVQSTSADSNFGTAQSVQMRYVSGAVQRQSYLYFDLSGVGSTVNGATLRLYQGGTTTTSITFDVYVVAASWNETVVTWNNKPATSGSSIGNQVTRTTAESAGWVEVTLTASAIETLRTGNNYGLVIIPRSGGSTSTATFHCRETSSGYDPELVVTP